MTDSTTAPAEDRTARMPSTSHPVHLPHLVDLPVAAPVMAVKPVTLAAPERGTDLQLKVSAPVSGTELPLIVFSHGNGSSLHAYEPLADFWAAHGFVVVQPTHLDSRTVGLPPDDPRTPEIWRIRVQDDLRVLDHLDEIEAAVPGLAGRVDHDRIAGAGHSFGAGTVAGLMGQRVLVPEDPEGGTDYTDTRVKAGLLLALAGDGGDALVPGAAERFPFFNQDFGRLTTRSLVVAGDHDVLPVTTRGAAWTTEPYHRSPGAEALLTLVGGEHSLGGIAGYEAEETTDEDPVRLSVVQQVTTAYLRFALGIDEDGWRQVQRAMPGLADAATLTTKPRRR